MSNLNFSIIQELKHQGICDASAAVPLGNDRFIVGNDEADKDLGNVLRVYDSQTSGEPLEIIDINNYFENNPDNEEIDLEAVSELNGVIYWMTSHGRSKKGKRKEERHQFFATQINNNDQPSLKKVDQSQSYTQLVLRDIIEDPKLAQFDFKIAETIAPKEPEGLNIEGLTATPEGELLIGFRNPIPNKKALLLPFKNPLDLVTKDPQQVRANFGDPILLDLQGLGIRSIEYWSVIDAYLIIAGTFDGGDEFALYTWSKNKENEPQKIDSLQFPEQFRPESVLFYPHLNDRFQILSDDGTVIRVNDQPCKEILDKDNSEKYFRSIWVQVN